MQHEIGDDPTFVEQQGTGDDFRAVVRPFPTAMS
jgi:hypothetical protein